MIDDTVTDDEGWLDYAVDATLSVFGRLDSVGYGNPGTIIIVFADWSQLVIETDSPRLTKPIALRSHVVVRCRRTEDGLYATAIWELGGVPIPLVPVL